jgi:hypothetical protein
MNGRTVDGGRVVVTELLESGAASARFRGELAFDPLQRRLITIGRQQTVPHAELARLLALEIRGVAPLDFIGPVDEPDEAGWRGSAMVEVEPRGRRADELAPIGERAAASLGLEIIEVIGRAHAAGQLIRGIRPELVYCDAGPGGEARLAGLVPRAPLFLETAPPASHGVAVLASLYRAPEDQLSFSPVPASDVFALCATLFALTAGRHPFGGELGQQIQRIAGGNVEPHPGRIGAVLAAGLAPDPAARLDLTDLAAALRAL